MEKLLRFVIPKSHRILFAGLLPTVIVVGFYTALFGPINTIAILRKEWIIIFIQVLIFSIPFTFLVFAGIGRAVVWIFSALFSVAFWGWFAIRVRQSAIEETGVDFGAALLMLSAPVIISFAGWLVDKLTRPPLR